jgi:hypothetical protein
MTASISLPWEKTAKVTMVIEDAPLFPTPGERGELREPTVDEFRQILIKLARLDFTCSGGLRPSHETPINHRRS